MGWFEKLSHDFFETDGDAKQKFPWANGIHGGVGETRGGVVPLGPFSSDKRLAKAGARGPWAHGPEGQRGPRRAEP